MQLLKKLVFKLFNLFGFQLLRIPKRIKNPSLITDENKISNQRIYIGCGDDFKEGYIGCDIRKTKAANIICKAWQLSNYVRDSEEIYTRHMLEHLTFAEVDASLADWYKSLKKNGVLRIIIPNMDYHVEQWKRAVWDENTMRDKKSNAMWSSAGFWGWQRETDPDYDDYNDSYWDVHKSGFNKDSISYFLKSHGFNIIQIHIVDNVHLHVDAIK